MHQGARQSGEGSDVVEDGFGAERALDASAAERVEREPGRGHETHLEALPALCLAAGFATAEARRDLAGLPRLTVARMAAAPAPA